MKRPKVFFLADGGGGGGGEAHTGFRRDVAKTLFQRHHVESAAKADLEKTECVDGNQGTFLRSKQTHKARGG